MKLDRIRWGVRVALLIGVAASVFANVLHAHDVLISRGIAAWPPLALLATVELISRVPVSSRKLSVARIVAAVAISLIAAWLSYWHMVGVAVKYGEDARASQYMLPLSVDGLIVVASICLVELGARIRAAELSAVAMGDGSPRAARDASPDAGVTRQVGMVFDHPRPIGPEPIAEPILSHPENRYDYERPIGPMPSRRPADTTRRTPPRRTAAERVAAAHARTPGATNGQIADRAKVSVSTVKRYRPAVAETVGAAA